MASKLLKSKDAWIQTFTGRRVYPANPHFDAFCIEDMAHSLSIINRFLGHTRVPYSVAQHCENMAKWFLKKGMKFEAKCALVHEPEEPYTGDMPTPLKYLQQMSAFRSIGKGIKETVLRKLEIYKMPPVVKELDTRMVVAEYKALFNIQDPEWLENFGDIDTSDLIIKPYASWRTAERNFLKMYDKLFDKRV